MAARVLGQVRSRRARRRSRNGFVWGLALAALLLVGFGQSPSASAALPPGFQESVVFSGLSNPTALRFSPDGRIFVAEKSGGSRSSTTSPTRSPTLFADLSTNVLQLLGSRACSGSRSTPTFPTSRTSTCSTRTTRAIGGTRAALGRRPACISDVPDTARADRRRLCRERPSVAAAGVGNVDDGSEQVLIEDWCQQYPSHSIGTLAFGADGALYVSGGDGASFNFADWGQDGSPLNPCGDPPDGVGGT